MPAALLCLLLLPLLAGPARGQVESREGIALQNQILQLRQELEQLRARSAGSALGAPPVAAPVRPGAGSADLLSQLLERVAALEEEVRRLRGRLDEAENRDRRLSEDLRKLTEDTDFRFQRLEGAGSAPARPAAPPAAAPAAPARPAAPQATPAPRTPDRALADGRAALERRDFAAAEAAAREVIASRNPGLQVAAHLLLGDALMGRRDFGNAALAYNEAYVRNRTGPRAPEALIGLANAFTALGNRREACDTLNDLRSNFPNLSGPIAERAQAARQRAQCR
ncbi:MAG: tetratricopeptide repeat protein [Rhodovarius sp.]|nr:tetratricopeptide repeat protein [Rhodovarius sp.]